MGFMEGGRGKGISGKGRDGAYIVGLETEDVGVGVYVEPVLVGCEVFGPWL